MSEPNEVQVDEAALTAEAAAVVAEAEAPGAPAGESSTHLPGESSTQLAAPVESWAPVIESTTPLLREIVFAQYVVTPGQWQAWEQGLIRSMDACFPGGIEGKFGGFVQAGLIVAGVGVANYVRNGRKMPPLGPVRAVQEKAAAGTDAPAH